MPTRTALIRPLFLAAAGLSACDSRQTARSTPDSAGDATHSAARGARSTSATPPHAGPTAEPLVLGAPVVRADGFEGASAVSVGADGRYYVRLERGAAGTSGDSVAAVDAATGTIATTSAADDIAAGRPDSTVDRHRRTYVVDSTSGQLAVVEPFESSPSASYPVLTGIDVPAAVAVDTVRGRLLVLERRAGTLRVFELP